MPVKKSTRAKKSRRAKTSTFAKRLARVRKSIDSIHLTREVSTSAIVLAVFCVAAAAMLIAALQSRDPISGATADARAKAASTQARAIEAPYDTTSNAPADKSNQKASAPQSPVTVTGCLEHNNETFRLKDTSGANAPKARSWKSGFLKKNPASIQVVDAANRVQLPEHVGQRVVVTGMLVDREMQVRSLQRVAASCNQEA